MSESSSGRSHSRDESGSNMLNSSRHRHDLTHRLAPLALSTSFRKLAKSADWKMYSLISFLTLLPALFRVYHFSTTTDFVHTNSTGHYYTDYVYSCAKLMAQFLYKEKTTMTSLVNALFFVLICSGRLIVRFCFGQLRLSESQHLYDRILNYTLFKIIFIGAVLEPRVEEIFIWLVWFTFLGFLRVFSLLCRDRFDFLLQSGAVHRQAHVRLLGLLAFIIVSDFFLFSLCAYLFHFSGLSILCLMTFDCFTLFFDTFETLLKYSIHLYDLSRSDLWEAKSTLFYYTDFACETIISASTLVHYLHIIYLHGMSFTLIDAVLFLNMRAVFQHLQRKIISFRDYRRMTADMEARYANVDKSELFRMKDECCAICRDTMLKSAKRLPCGHVFHASCIRTWSEHHGSCPTCRRNLMRNAENNEKILSENTWFRWLQKIFHSETSMRRCDVSSHLEDFDTNHVSLSRLIDMFPNVPLEMLETAVRNSTSIEEAIDYVLEKIDRRSSRRHDEGAYIRNDTSSHASLNELYSRMMSEGNVS